MPGADCCGDYHSRSYDVLCDEKCGLTPDKTTSFELSRLCLIT
jgi:hypothetical protein